MNKISTFVTESVEEMKNNVSWPTWAELQKSSVLVLVASLIFALVIGASDFAIKNLMQIIYNLSS
jgi:preprotein translocase subunit SecE